jgi:hypothetical protein
LLGLVIIISKLLIVAALVGLLRCSETFCSQSREFDERVMAGLRRLMHESHEQGISPQAQPLLILLMTFGLMLSLYFIGATLK